MANLTNLIDLDGLRAFKDKNDEARANAITEALDDYKNNFVSSDSSEPGTIMVTSNSEATSGTGSYDDPYIMDFTVVQVTGDSRTYYKNTSSGAGSVASTSDIEALFS